MDCPASAPPILRCLLPRIFCQLGFFDCKQQKLTLAKQNDDGRAGEPGLGKDSVRGGSGDLSNRVQDPTTGMNQLPPFPVHFLTLQNSQEGENGALRLAIPPRLHTVGEFLKRKTGVLSPDRGNGSREGQNILVHWAPLTTARAQ